MKNSLLVFILMFATSLFASELKEIKKSDIRIRDPFVFLDKKTGTYYMPSNLYNGFDKNAPKGLKMYSSKDLKVWKDLGVCYTPPAYHWGQSLFWAPDMIERNGKYYILVTMGCNRPIGKSSQNPNEDIFFKGCAALVADKPEGPYKPVSDSPLTPKDWASIDGTVYDDGNKLWFIYCHEWIQTGDGEIIAQEISGDLSKLIGEPKLLFKASQAPWTKRLNPKKVSYVTDAGVINKLDDGTLIMTWSCFSKKGYAIGLAVSLDGKVDGKWHHYPFPINDDDGGHAMLFKDKSGNLKISYHAPNSGKRERMQLRPFIWKNGSAFLGDKE